MANINVRLMDTDSDYKKMGTKKGCIEVWEDGKRDAACIEPSTDTSCMDGSSWFGVCNFSCKTAFRRSGTEFYEPGTRCKMFLTHFLYRTDDVFCV